MAANYSFDSFRSFISNNFTLLIIGAIIYGAGFFTGSLYTENSMYKKGGTPTAAAPTAQAPEDDGPSKESLAGLPPITADDHIRGSLDASVIIVEYSDFECPFCARFHPTMEQIREEYGDDVAWVYRHFPLSFHPNAQPAAEASECVAEQGGNDAFWTYADYVFEQNELQGGSISPEVIQDGAEAAGVDMTAFNECLDSGKYTELVQQQMADGTAAGINATPGNVIFTQDGPQEAFLGAYPLEQVRSLVEKYM